MLSKILSVFLLSAVPLAAFSQEQQPAAAPANHASTEIGIGMIGGIYGHPGDAYPYRLGGGGFRLLRNVNRFQFGLQIDLTTMSSDGWSLTPALTGNYRIIGTRGYWYGGVTAGYVSTGSWSAYSPVNPKPAQGYMFGLQGGYVRQLGRHLAFSSELAIRSSQTWDTYNGLTPQSYQNNGCYVETYDYKMLTTRIDVPVSIGLRYTF